ncbi:Plasminogen, partial [Merops nubicus]
KGDILDDYLRTDGVWILTRNKEFYKTNNEKECAEKCEAERNFNCRAFLFTRKKLQCLTLAENTKTTVSFNSTDAILYEKKIYLLQCKRGIGKDYRGTEAKTWRGIPCQKWAEKTPHNPNYTPEKHPNAGLDENYCRNPDGDENGPWCYTTDPATRFDYCNIPECEGQVMHTGEAECMQCNGEDYRGEVSRTESGLECQPWDAQEPHMHAFTLKHFPEKDLRKNYCRNPDGELRPWCFTTSPTKRWEYCNIPRCTTHLPASGLGSQCLSGKGEDYRGRIAITESGNACQQWNMQFPHRHGWIPDRYPCKGLEENYCRNPDGEKRPWCYTTTSSVRWEYCAIPHCGGTERGIADVRVEVPLPEECYRGKGQSYRGTTSITVSGKICQAWNSMFPHRHEKTPDRFPNADLRDNYCRNPDGDSRPWCFTTDSSVTWEYCNLRTCDDHVQEPVPNDPPATMAQHASLTTPTASDCINGNGKDYRGTVAKTGTGRTCQEWSSQKPHSHKYFTPVTHPRAGLDKNYCRNPDGDIHGVWCFTTDPEKTWEYCEIPRCSLEHDCGKVPMRSERACEPHSMCDASPGSWPWHVSLRTRSNVHRCAGTLIHPQWVLTAAQCFQESTEPFSYRVFLGTENLNAAEPSLQIRSVQKVVKEPSGADIALLKLDSPVTITDRVKPVCLPETNLMVERNAVCFLTAWGKTRDNRLKVVELPVLENSICNRPEFLNGSVKNHEFCGGFTFGSIENCEAEVGGPLVCQDKDRFVQYGVTSRGLDCTQTSKPVFVRIPSFTSWIK